MIYCAYQTSWFTNSCVFVCMLLGSDSPTLLRPDEVFVKTESEVPIKSKGSQVTFEEIAPERNQIITKRSAIQNGESGRRKDLPRNVRRYYKELEKQKTRFLEGNLSESEEEHPARVQRKVAIAVRLSLVCNLVLLAGKAVAAYLSASMSIISSLVDSAVDLVSGVVVWYTNRSIKNTDFHEYPEGKSRLEPLGIVIVSVVMTVASIQLILTSITKMIEETVDLDMTIPTVIIIATTIIVKALLFLYCRQIKQPSTSALAQDHRNDCVSNAFALGFGYLGYKVWKNADPLGAILIGLYIAIGWWRTGAEQIRSLTGHSARPELLQKLLWVCMNHDAQVLYVDTLRAYHFGNNVLVEAHIVLPPEMMLRTAHDVGESLQQKLEGFSDVERAFVHIDYDYEHHPCVEHKMGPQPSST